ncbi:MAG: hypothetical protein LQ346_002706 [Caloplaca aetnensis]|nr:MAG: hypothetical protein LQ346_002706 [Caloplaca aetnensis]
MPVSNFIQLVNARVYRDGYIPPPRFKSTPDPLSKIFVDRDTGLISRSPPSATDAIETIDLQNRILAPAFLELQTNGCVGVHFTQYTCDEEYLADLEKVGRWMATKGVGGWWATVPTVGKEVYRKD